MSKKKKAKSQKKSKGSKSAGGKASTTKTPGTAAQSSRPQPGAGSTAALRPAPALPAGRDRKTRGGKTTHSVHELLAQVPTPPRPAAKPAPEQPLTLAQIYETLAALLVPYARKMESEMHPRIGFCLKARSARTGRETHFGAVQILPEGVVAYHLFPLYAHPELVERVSPNLFNRMRGKTCFHFDTLDAGLVAELAELTNAGFERFLADGVL